jgi:hypothetical protein
MTEQTTPMRRRKPAVCFRTRSSATIRCRSLRSRTGDRFRYILRSTTTQPTRSRRTGDQIPGKAQPAPPPATAPPRPPSAPAEAAEAPHPVLACCRAGTPPMNALAARSAEGPPTPGEWRLQAPMSDAVASRRARDAVTTRCGEGGVDRSRSRGDAGVPAAEPRPRDNQGDQLPRSIPVIRSEARCERAISSKSG